MRAGGGTGSTTNQAKRRGRTVRTPAARSACRPQTPPNQNRKQERGEMGVLIRMHACVYVRGVKIERDYGGRGAWFLQCRFSKSGMDKAGVPA